MASIRLKLLGGFAASLSSGRRVELVGKKNQALLAYLAVNRGKRHSREKLMGLLWSDRGEAQARGSLRQALAALKEALAGVEPAPLVLDGDGVALDPAVVSTDVASFEQLAGSESVDDLRQAAKLYEGELLDETAVPDPGFEEWLVAEQARLREVAIGVLGRLTSRLAGTDAFATGQRLVGLDPLREASHRGLMQAYAAAGENALALQQYARCRDLLQAELGVAPARETEELRRRLIERDLRPTVTEPSAESKASPAIQRRADIASPELISIAVMPLANISGDPTQDYFADGLTEDLITALTKSRHLHVIARNTTFQYKNRAVSMPQLGRELGAHYVVEGSVRRSATRIRVTAQLSDPRGGNHVWAERFDRDLADIFAVQDEIVQAISAQLGYALIDAAASGRCSTTASTTAYDYLLRGRSSWRRGAVIETRDAWLKAVEADPSYAVALASLAFLFSEDLWMQETGEPVEELAKLAQDYVNRAITVDEGDAYAHLNLGSALVNLGQLEEGRHHMELALSLNPHFPNTTISLGCAIAFGGQHREGLAMIDRAFRLEPRLSPTMRSVPFYVSCIMGDPDGAKSRLLSIDIDRSRAHLHLFMAACLASSGRVAEAKSHVLAFEAKRPAWFDVVGFSQWVGKALALPEDKERFLIGLRQAGLSV